MHAPECRLILCGNLHLGGQLFHFPTLTNTHQEILRDATLTAFERTIELVLEASVDTFVITGRVFASSPTLRIAALFRDGLETLLEEGIQVIHAGPDADMVESLQRIDCLPAGLEILKPHIQGNHATTLQGQSNRGIRLWCEQQSNDLHHQSAWPGRHQIGISWQEINPGRHDHDGFHSPENEEWLIVCSAAESTLTERTRNTILHSPGSIQSLNHTYPGMRSVTLCEISTSGQIDLQSLATSAVAYESLDLTLEQEHGWEQISHKVHTELLRLSHTCLTEPVQLCGLSWNVRTPSDLVNHWSSDSLARRLQASFSSWEKSIPISHQVTMIPQFSGTAEPDQTTAHHQPDEADLLRILGKECVINPQQLAGDDSWTRGLDLSQLLPQLPVNDITSLLNSRDFCHRSAELGLQAWEEQRVG